MSQSGATAFGPLTTRAVDLGLGYSHIISTGNEADLESSDFIDYLLDEPHVRVVACFIEGLKDGRKFLAAAKKALRLGKSIALIKVGRSPVGANAARSHTAALTGSDEVQNALFRQFGVARCEDYDDLIQTAHLLAYAPALTADGVAVVSHSGGISSLIADDLGHAGNFSSSPKRNCRGGAERDSLRLRLGGQPRRRHRRGQPEGIRRRSRPAGAGTTGGSVAHSHRRNPVTSRDCAGLEDPNVKASGLPFNGRRQRRTRGLAMLREANVPVFNSPSRAAKSLASLFWIPSASTEVPGLERGIFSRGPQPTPLPQPSLPAGPTTMTEHAAKIFLSHWGITPTREVQAWSLKDAIEVRQDNRLPRGPQAGVAPRAPQNRGRSRAPQRPNTERTASAPTGKSSPTA